MIYFVGAGPGAVDLITVRGARLLAEADVIVYAGSLVNPELLKMAKPDCKLYDSAKLNLPQVLAILTENETLGKTVVRLHTGDPSLFGAIKEQMEALDEKGLTYTVVPGVSSFSGAAAALQAEYTLPGISQSVIITRMEGRTPVPEREKLHKLAAHGTTMVLFLSTGLLTKVQEELIIGGYAIDTPAAIVYKATWPEEQVFKCSVGTLAETAQKQQISKTALIVIGQVLAGQGEKSCLYDPAFSHEYRQGQN